MNLARLRPRLIALLAVMGVLILAGGIWLHAERRSTPSFSQSSPVTIPRCDIDADGDVDVIDLRLIRAANGQLAIQGDPRDGNRDGRINVADVRFCQLRLLPPDPGEAGKQTLEGIDSDGDGLRDDVQRYIAIRFPETPPTIAALQQFTRASQDFILKSSSSRSELTLIDEQRLRGLYCLNYVRSAALQDDVLAAREVYDLIRDLKTVLLNTRDRAKAFFAADSKLSGSSSSLIDRTLWASQCE